MVDVLRKHVAPAHRILVDAKAFLNPEFSDAVLYFTGAHIELMRNLVDYANRRTTFVSDYYIGYYLSPDDTDWNLIQAVVADLESTLMGNNNVIWGYTDTKRIIVVEPDAIAGTNTLESDAVPSEEVWMITLVRGWNATSVSGSTNIAVISGGTAYPLDDLVSPSAGQDVRFTGNLVMKEGDKLRFRSWGTTLNDDLYLVAVGSVMAVPA